MEKDFVTYEYRTVSVKAKEQTRATDLYEAFGWEITASNASAVDGVALSMRRDRKQKHRQELIKLERQAEETLGSIRSLQASKTLGASIFAYIFGVIAALVLGGGMCLVMLVEGSIPAMAGGIALGVIGLALCGVNYLIYARMAAKKTAEVLPAIDQTEEKLANILEKGNDLLKADLI